MTKNVLKSAALVALLLMPAEAFAGSLSGDQSRIGQTPANPPDARSGGMFMARGTDLRPCGPGEFSSFDRSSGGYRCVSR